MMTQTVPSTRKNLLAAFTLSLLVGGFIIGITAIQPAAEAQSTSVSTPRTGNSGTSPVGKIPPNFPQPKQQTNQSAQASKLDNGPKSQPRNVIKPTPPIQQRAPIQPRT